MRRSSLAAAVGFGLALAAAACDGGASTATSPSGVSPSSLAAQNGGQSTRNFSVTVTPPSVTVGTATLHVTVTRDAASGQSQQLGSVEIYVPGEFSIQSVSNISNTEIKMIPVKASNDILWKSGGDSGWVAILEGKKSTNKYYMKPFDPFKK